MSKALWKSLCLAVVICLAAAGLASAQETIKIGVAGAHTGDLANYGLPTIKAAELVAKSVNDAGGLLGKKVEIVAQDDQCNPAQATSAANKLISDHVVVVIGHICSGATKAALPIYKSANIPVMSPSATATTLTQSGDYPNFFRTISYDAIQGKVSAEFAMDKLGLKKLAVIHDKGEYGKGYAEFAKATIEKSGKAKVVLFEGITPGEPDYETILLKVKQVGADGIIFGGYHPEASKLVMGMVKRKMKLPFISDDGVNGEDILKIAGADAEGIYASGPEDYSNNPIYKAAVEAHKKAYGSEPGMFFGQAYAAAQAYTNAIAKAGSTDYAAVTKALRDNLVETSVGKIKFDDKGDAIGVGFSIYQVQKGKWTMVK
jgi:branched-chain amino acid transport system substrate-binding protein